MDRILDLGGYNLEVPLYTIVPYDMVLAPDNNGPLELKERQQPDGSRVVLRSDGTVERLISTDPQHYLSSHLTPGLHLP